MSELADRLREIHSWRKPAGGVHGQMLGCEPYTIRASGNALEWLIEAADHLDAVSVRLAKAEAALRGAREALVDAKETIKTWHNIDGSADVWPIYERSSPEMKRLNAAIAALADEPQKP